jgi:hypothetical protein
MAGSISYYFTLFKKFQVLNHVPSQTVHGNPSNPTNGFQLNNPSCVFGGTNHFPSLLGSAPGNSPLWQILNAAATGQGNVAIGSYNGPSMPLGASSTSPDSWVNFQIHGSPPIVTLFGTWITNGKTNDIPNGVVNPNGGAIKNVPAAIAGPLDNGVALFACSMANDNGQRPGAVPSNYWATSLIYLVDPKTGNFATLNNGTLNAGDEWFLVGVIGNRGNTATGDFMTESFVPSAGVQSAAVVMVWSTTFGPGVELPALSNLDVTATNPIYDSYIMRSGAYDVVGFRLNVQNVFNGIIAALVAEGPPGSTPTTPLTILGGATAEQWVLTQPAHLCAKLVVRQSGGSFPDVGDTPLNNRAVAQKNLAPFQMSISDTDSNPMNIVWKNFVTGTPFLLRVPEAGRNRLGLVLKAPQDVVQLLLAIPTETFERYFRNGPGRLTGFQEISPKQLADSPLGRKAKPFPNAVVLRYLGGEHVIEFPALPEKRFLAMSLGVEYQQHKMKAGPVGEVEVVHFTELTKAPAGTRASDVKEVVVGGFTLQLEAVHAK